MGGVFGCISTHDCVDDLFYGTDYLSHLGTRRGGLAIKGPDGFKLSIHNIENAYFRNRFEGDLTDFKGNQGIGVISDTDPQPMIISSHLGRCAIVTIGKINNMGSLAEKAFVNRQHFAEMSGPGINPTELVAMLICMEPSFADGIAFAQESVKGSCSMLLLTDEGSNALSLLVLVSFGRNR